MIILADYASGLKNGDEYWTGLKAENNTNVFYWLDGVNEVKGYHTSRVERQIIVNPNFEKMRYALF